METVSLDMSAFSRGGMEDEEAHPFLGKFWPSPFWIVSRLVSTCHHAMKDGSASDVVECGAPDVPTVTPILIADEVKDRVEKEEVLSALESTGLYIYRLLRGGEKGGTINGWNGVEASQWSGARFRRSCGTPFFSIIA